jgi:signal transduction histidine kinase/GAF domain-containing protein
MDKRTRAVVWLLLTCAVLAISGLSAYRLDWDSALLQPILFAIALSAWLGFNYIRIGHNVSLTFIHSIGIFLGITLGPYAAILAITFGLLLSASLDRLRGRCISPLPCGRRWIGIASRQTIALAGGIAIYRLLGGKLISGRPALPEPFPTLALAIVFSLLFVSFHAVERWLRSSDPMTRRESMLVSLIALGPIPIVIIGVAAFSVFSNTALIIYGATLAFAAPTIRALIDLQSGLARKTRSLAALFDLATSREKSVDGTSYFALIDIALTELALAPRAALFLRSSLDQSTELVHSFNIPAESIRELQHPQFLTNLPGPTSKHTPDQYQIENIPGLPAEIQTSLHDLGVRQLIPLPLINDDQRIGELLLLIEQEQRLSNDEFDQLGLFANQLSKSIEHSHEFAATNAELKRRVEQLARLEAIGRQVTASIAIEDVYQTIVYHGIQATSATRGHLEVINLETDSLEIVSPENGSGIGADAERFPSRTVQKLAQRVFETGQVTNVPNASLDPEFGSETVDPHSLLFAPIISNGETIGVIMLSKDKPGGFTDDEEAFIIQLASQAANALRNAKMYEELQQRLREQSLLYQASAQITESLETESVSLALADSLAFAVNADSTLIYRFSSESRSLEFVAGIDGKTTLEKAGRDRSLSIEIPAVKACIENRRPIQWSSADPPTEMDGAHLISNGVGACLLLPLIVGERTLGLVQLNRQRAETFEQEELRTAQSIAIQASIILENSELFQQISRSNNRLSAVLNSTREGMLMIDKSGKIAVANSQLKDLIHVDPDELSEANLDELEEDLIHRLGYRQKEIDDLVSSLQSGKGHLPGISTYEIAGEDRQILRRLETPVHDSDGKLIGWLIVIRDVSEEMQLEESRKHLTEMIVHDLRSPLSAILNSMELLRMQLKGQEQSPILQQALAISDRSVQQMLGLVNALLDLSKLESGQFVIASNKIDFYELIPHLVDTFLPEAEQAGVILDYRIAPKIGKVVLDEAKIFRVISNLVDNALKFTPAGGKVAIEILKKDEQLFIEVIDNGPGIPPDYHERIFDLYAQVPGTEGRRRGTGLGLAFCKLAVEAHNGEIWVESNPDGGSRFRIRLPIEDK